MPHVINFNLSFQDKTFEVAKLKKPRNPQNFSPLKILGYIVYDYDTNEANLCNICITDSAVVVSSPVVGSSRNNTPGDTTISMAMLQRFLCPPDTPRTNGVPIYARFVNLHKQYIIKENKNLFNQP